MLFIGVSTAGSSIFELFPRWAQILGFDASLEGYDIPLGAPPEAFRAAVEHIARDPERRGALVTTHKVDVYRHAGDLFAELDSNARLCGEVSCISKRDERLVGHAKDPLTAGRTLAEFVPPGLWESGAHVLCLGAGGAGTAIVVHLVGLDGGPEQLVVSDTEPARLEGLAGALEQLGALSRVRLEHVRSSAENDALLEPLPPGSLVVNATGLGKDAPGSPISDGATFPPRGLVWELNYRGDLRFLRQARRQEEDRRLDLQDGWRYFLHGWSEVIAEVFDLGRIEERFAQLAEAAEQQRSSSSLSSAQR
jgi:shikimate 5-dehydrogenase